jgi:hypothetical protein
MNLTRRLFVSSVAVSPMFAYGQSGSIAVRIAGKTVPVQAVVAILERRFESVKPGAFNGLSTQVSGSRIVLTFSGWAPSKAQSDYLLSTTGNLKIFFQGEQDNPLINESDIADARPLSGGAKNELAIRLTEAAAKRVAARTRDSTSKEVVVEWEQRVIARLRTAGPLSRDIALAIPADVNTLLMSAALRGGRIPDGITLTLAL